jgi:hypothetical protein
MDQIEDSIAEKESIGTSIEKYLYLSKIRLSL